MDNYSPTTSSQLSINARNAHCCFAKEGALGTPRATSVSLYYGVSGKSRVVTIEESVEVVMNILAELLHIGVIYLKILHIISFHLPFEWPILLCKCKGMSYVSMEMLYSPI